MRTMNLSAAFASVLLVAATAWATGSWEGPNFSHDTNLPPPDSGGQWVYVYGFGTFQANSWDSAITGADGSFSGNAEAQDLSSLVQSSVTSGVSTAIGWTQQSIDGWDPGQGTCQHVAPSNARVTGQGDGTVVGAVFMDANNGSYQSGQCTTLAYGKIIFSGVVSGSVTVNLNTSWGEWDTAIQGTLSTDPSVSVTQTIKNDTAQATTTDTISLTQQYGPDNIAGQLVKGYGTCSVSASIANGANKATSNVQTAITVCTLTKSYGGTGICGDDPPHEGH